MSDKVSNWGGDDDGDAVAPAAQGSTMSMDMLRKALTLNPQMKGNQSTQEVMTALEKAKLQGGTAAASKQATPSPTGSSSAGGEDFADVVMKQRKRYMTERLRLRDQQAAIEKQIAALGPSVQSHLIAAVHRIDPNMTSPKTKAVLEIEKPFLDEVGFSAKAVAQQQLKRS